MWGIIGTIVGWIWDGIKAVGTGLSFVGQEIWPIIKRAATSIWNAARFSWTHILRPVGQWLDRMYQRVKAFYEDIYSKVHGWLTRITKALRTVYEAYFRPILNTIDHVRRVLHLLALLQVEFAAKLDHELALLEQKIALPIQKAIEVVNAIDSRIEAYILTVDNLFKRVTLLGSVARDIGQIANLQWRASMRNIPGRDVLPKPAHASLILPDAHVDDFLAALDEETPDPDSPVGQGLALMNDFFDAAGVST